MNLGQAKYIFLVIGALLGSVTVFGQFVQPQFVPPPTRFDITPATAAQNAYYQQQQAAIAAQKAADQEAAKQAELDAAIAELDKERDAAVTKLETKYAPDITDLESQDSTHKQKAAELQTELTQTKSENTHLRAKQLFQPKNPWRSIDGKIYNAKDKDWFQFTGRVLEVKTNGILVGGNFGPPLDSGFGERNYFVENFPSDTYAFADGEEIEASMNFVAHMGGKTTFQFTHTKIDLGVETVRRLDYGKVVDSPPPDLAQKWNNVVIVGIDDSQISKQLEDNQKEQSEIEQKLLQVKNDFTKEKDAVMADYEAKIKVAPDVLAKQAKDKEDAKKQAAYAKAVAYNQAQADKGDSIGLLRMGERYRDGDGVPKDLTKAKDYLTKAAAAGEPSAADELKELPAN